MAISKTKTRKTNERFFDEYRIFDMVLCERFNIEEHGVSQYMKRMKEAVTEAREAIPEWDTTYARLAHIQNRHAQLKTDETSFEDFQGKDEDVVWMQVFCEKLDADADPLSKYSKMEFTYKKRGMSFLQKLLAMFNVYI